MSYVINKTSGEPLLTLEDGVVNTSTSLGLVGRNFVGYGEIQNENFLHLMENFANNNPPSRPVQGQNWFDTQDNLLKIYDGSGWTIVGSASLSEDPPENSSSGSLWLKLPEKSLYVYDGENWQIVGPEIAPGFGLTRARSTVLLDTEGRPNPVILLTVDNKVIAIICQKEFLISSQNSIDGFSRIFPGINLISNMNITGNLQGNAQTATRLSSFRKINGINFNGDSDITIKSSTEKFLKRGTHLIGQNFDGSNETTWSVDASSESLIGKVVVRDSTGSFSANIINAELVGNVKGNVETNAGTSKFNIVEANQFIGANLSGNARTATRLQFDRTINGVVFNGTADITIPASASTLTGNSINPAVTLSRLTQVGTLTSLSVSDAGISIGSGNQLRVLLENINPTIASSSDLPLQLRTGDIGINLIPASQSLSAGGDNLTSIIPSINLNLNIGHPSFTFNKIYANTFIGNLDGQSSTSVSSNSSNNLSGGSSRSIPYQFVSGETRFLPAGQPGQVLKTGGSSGELSWGSVTFTPLEIGEYLLGSDYNGNDPAKWSVDATPSNQSLKIVARDSEGNFSAGTIAANLTGNVVGNVTGNVIGNSTTATRLQTARTINGVQFDGSANITVQATDPTKVNKTGDTMTGQLSLNLSPVQPQHATNKAYVDSRLPQYTFVSGNTILTGGFTNQVGSFNNNSNFFDVFPPSGKTMSNLVAFIPSIAFIAFAGNVNADDSMRCIWVELSDRIRVRVQNTEQRDRPAANYLAIWS
jgi:hypothetical protein